MLCLPFISDARTVAFLFAFYVPHQFYALCFLILSIQARVYSLLFILSQVSLFLLFWRILFISSHPRRAEAQPRECLPFQCNRRLLSCPWSSFAQYQPVLHQFVVPLSILPGDPHCCLPEFTEAGLFELRSYYSVALLPPFFRITNSIILYFLWSLSLKLLSAFSFSTSLSFSKYQI